MSMRSTSAKWSPDSWRSKPRMQMPDYPDAKALAEVEAQLATFPPLVFAGEARNLKKALAAGRSRRGFPAAGRRLRRELRRARRQQYPRFLPAVSADGGGADLCGGLAGGESRPRCRPVRQAAHLADRKARRRRAAGLSRRHHQRHRIHRRGAHARSAPATGGLSAIGGDAQSSARFRHRRLRQPVECASMDAVVRQGLTAVEALFQELASHLTEALGFMRACGIDPRIASGNAHDRFLHQPRGAAARLRAGVHSRRFHDRRLVLHQRPHGVDRRPHPAARSRPCRILPRHQESARPEDRPDAEGRRAA